MFCRDRVVLCNASVDLASTCSLLWWHVVQKVTFVLVIHLIHHPPFHSQTIRRRERAEVSLRSDEIRLQPDHTWLRFVGLMAPIQLCSYRLPSGPLRIARGAPMLWHVVPPRAHLVSFSLSPLSSLFPVFVSSLFCVRHVLPSRRFPRPRPFLLSRDPLLLSGLLGLFLFEGPLFGRGHVLHEFSFQIDLEHLPSRLGYRK